VPGDRRGSAELALPGVVGRWNRTRATDGARPGAAALRLPATPAGMLRNLISPRASFLRPRTSKAQIDLGLSRVTVTLYETPVLRD
jgi:hypothetical protein